MALIFQVKVVPSSGRNICILDKSGALKIYLKSPPERNKANQELLKLLSQELRVPVSAITILSGATSPQKRLKIDADISYQKLLELLGIQTQMELFNKKG